MIIIECHRRLHLRDHFDLHGYSFAEMPFYFNTLSEEIVFENDIHIERCCANIGMSQAPRKMRCSQSNNSILCLIVFVRHGMIQQSRRSFLNEWMKMWEKGMNESLLSSFVQLNAHPHSSSENKNSNMDTASNIANVGM